MPFRDSQVAGEEYLPKSIVFSLSSRGGGVFLYIKKKKLIFDVCTTREDGVSFKFSNAN